jgi:polyferredoxin
VLWAPWFAVTAVVEALLSLIGRTLLALLVTGFAVTLSGRNVVGIDVIRDRNALYRERPDGRIENVYNVKILTKDREAHEFRITASGLAGIETDYIGPTVWVAQGAVQSVPVRIRVPRGELQGGADVILSIEAVDDPQLTASGQARFIAPTD